ncbi:hypothetical protein N7510_002611 [Penicillium lagena]|uniref:uncharacterized protein n=1 Tax=Penicillium lagena TaxID=94218 RepID=UPI00254173B8|nr:uncharacterized protein N7510_002611 [Penicillium lagena]KAJ5626302.1 hypothetical protein N7510_002611 [Penicillium lagena]
MGATRSESPTQPGLEVARPEDRLFISNGYNPKPLSAGDSADAPIPVKAEMPPQKAKLRARNVWIVVVIIVIVIAAAVGGGVGRSIASKSDHSKSRLVFL